MSIRVVVSLAAAIRQIICIAILAAEPCFPSKYSRSLSVRLKSFGSMSLSSKLSLSVIILLPFNVADLAAARAEYCSFVNLATGMGLLKIQLETRAPRLSISSASQNIIAAGAIFLNDNSSKTPLPLQDPREEGIINIFPEIIF